MVAERSLPKLCYTLLCSNKQKHLFIPPLKMSASLPTISMLDEEDACIHKHEMAITKTKCAKEEMQRQCEEEEAQRAAEAERLWREAEAEKAQREAEAKEAQRMVEAEEAQKRAEDEERAQEEAEKA